MDYKYQAAKAQSAWCEMMEGMWGTEDSAEQRYQNAMVPSGILKANVPWKLLNYAGKLFRKYITRNMQNLCQEK